MKYNSGIREFKEWEFFKRFLYNLVLSTFLALIVCICLVKISGVRLDEVLSDSMSPKFTKSDIIVVKKQDSYKIGDIVEYRKTSNGFSTNITHRIIDYDESTGLFRLQGDAVVSDEKNDDYITQNMINGKVIAIWRNGRAVYHMIRDNYFLLLGIVFGCWVFSSALSTELEIRKHDIAK